MKRGKLFPPVMTDYKAAFSEKEPSMKKHIITLTLSMLKFSLA
jgi:hypothetical protein